MSRTSILFILLFPCLLFAQSPKEGRVIFEEKINLHKKLGDKNPELLAMIPEYKSNFKTLLFNPEKSIYRNSTETESAAFRSEGSDQDISAKFGGSDNVVFRDLKGENSIEKKNFMGRIFLIEGEASAKKWKLTGEQEKVAGFICMKAIADDSTQTQAWFTPQIPIQVGPGSQNGLPGLILKVANKDESLIIEAKKVAFAEIPKEEMLPPEKGKKVSREEFDQIMKEKLEEMKSLKGGGTFKIIKN